MLPIPNTACLHFDTEKLPMRWSARFSYVPLQHHAAVSSLVQPPFSTCTQRLHLKCMRCKLCMQLLDPAWAPRCHWVTQISYDYFENAMAHFTATIYNAIKARPTLHLYPSSGTASLVARTPEVVCNTLDMSCTDASKAAHQQCCIKFVVTKQARAVMGSTPTQNASY